MPVGIIGMGVCGCNILHPPTAPCGRKNGDEKEECEYTGVTNGLPTASSRYVFSIVVLISSDVIVRRLLLMATSRFFLL